MEETPTESQRKDIQKSLRTLETAPGRCVSKVYVCGCVSVCVRVCITGVSVCVTKRVKSSNNPTESLRTLETAPDRCTPTYKGYPLAEKTVFHNIFMFVDTHYQFKHTYVWVT